MKGWMAVDKNDIQKTYNYEQIRANKDNDLAWVENVITDLWRGHKITTHEAIFFVDSLDYQGTQND